MEQEIHVQNKELQEKFIVLQIENENFVIPLEYVSEIVRVKEITQAPHQPEWVKGIMNLRDSVISLIDTRKRLGIKSLIEDPHEFFERVKNAHLNWINKLEESIEQKTQFNLALDHTKCEFGKLSVELLNRPDVSSSIKRKLTEMEADHKAIHDGGKIVVNLTATNQETLARAKAKEIKENLVPKILTHLTELEVTFLSVVKNIAVIIEYNSSHFAMLADDIKKMKTFKLENKQKGSLTDSPFIMGVFDSEEGLYQELDLKGILSGHDLGVDFENAEPQPAKQTVNLKELTQKATAENVV